MVDENRPEGGWGSRIVKGFYKSWAWIAAVGGFLIAVVPELASYLLLHSGVINTAFPKMSPETKELVLSVAVGLVIVLRPYKQPKSWRPDEGATQPVVSVKIPESIVVEPGGAPLEVEVERHERIQNAAAATGQVAKAVESATTVHNKLKR